MQIPKCEERTDLIKVILYTAGAIVLAIAVYEVANYKVFTCEVADNFDKYRFTTTAVGNLADIIELFKIHQLRYPNELEELTNSWGKMPRGYITRKSLLDAWGNEYIYKINTSGYTVKSYGADGREGGEGLNLDITHVQTKNER